MEFSIECRLANKSKYFRIKLIVSLKLHFIACKHLSVREIIMNFLNFKYLFLLYKCPFLLYSFKASPG